MESRITASVGPETFLFLRNESVGAWEGRVRSRDGQPRVLGRALSGRCTYRIALILICITRFFEFNVRHRQSGRGGGRDGVAVVKSGAERWRRESTSCLHWSDVLGTMSRSGKELWIGRRRLICGVSPGAEHRRVYSDVTY